MSQSPSPKRRKTISQTTLFQCNECFHYYKNASSLKQHVKEMHTNIEQFPCLQCNYVAKRQRTLDIHVTYKHSDKKPFVCSQCKNAFKTQGDLTKHINTVHMDDRSFACSQCQKTFKRQKDLNTHLNTVHSNQRPFACSQCSYASKTQGDLTKHIKTVHTDDKPFVCSQCIYASKTRSGLQQHIRYVHHQERKHACMEPTCEAKFFHRPGMLRHFEACHTPEGAQRRKQEERKLELALKDAELYFDREVTINFQCLDSSAPKKFARLDFVHERADTTFVIEVDEHQHKDEPVTCETARMTRVFENYAVTTGALSSKPLCFIRFNPHAFQIDDVTQKVLKKTRYAKLIDLLKTYQPQKLLEIIYLYYDCYHDDEKRLRAEIWDDPDYDETLKQCAIVIN